MGQATSTKTPRQRSSTSPEVGENQALTHVPIVQLQMYVRLSRRPTRILLSIFSQHGTFRNKITHSHVLYEYFYNAML